MTSAVELFVLEVRDIISSLRHALGSESDVKLGFSEFCLLFPETVTQAADPMTMREWFRMADVDGNNSLELGELFVWACSVATAKSGSGGMSTRPPIHQIFRRYDKDNSGCLDELEFVTAVRELGLGDRAEELFRYVDNMDLDADGLIRYKRIVDRVYDMSRSKHMRSLIKALVEDAHLHPRKLGIDTSGWSWKGKDPEDARLQLKALLQQEGVTLTQVFKTMDGDGSGSLSQLEFKEALEDKLGYTGLPVVALAIFDELDYDRSGKVGYAEMDEWLLKGSGARAAAAMAEKLSLRDRIKASEEPWDEMRLRKEVQTITEQIGMKTADLVRAWDKSNDNQIDKKELLTIFKKLVEDEDLWYSHVREGVLEAFRKMDSGKSGSIDFTELNDWLKYEGKGPYPAPHAVFTRGGTSKNDESANVGKDVTKGAATRTSTFKSPSRPITSLRPPPPSPRATAMAKRAAAKPKAKKPPPRYCNKYPEWMEKTLQEGKAATWLAGRHVHYRRPASPALVAVLAPSCFPSKRREMVSTSAPTTPRAPSWRSPPKSPRSISPPTSPQSLSATSGGGLPRRTAMSPPYPSVAWSQDIILEQLKTTHGDAFSSRSGSGYEWVGKLQSARARAALLVTAPSHTGFEHGMKALC